MQEDFKSIRRLRYPLPDEVHPETSVCIEVHVPNDIAYISAFWGQMFALTRWYAWAGDALHTGKEVAAVWRDVYEAAQESECENVLVRTNPFNSCELQVSYDGGEVWVTKFDARPCAITAINDTLGSGSEQPGGRTQPGEQTGGADPEPETCWTFDATVFANQRWLIPLPITSDWTVFINTWTGCTNGGGIPTGLVWSCPDGKQFVLGTCSAFTMPTDSGDPLPAQPHMRLILQLPDGSYTVINKNSLYVLPGGLPAGNAYLMVNDSDLTDNSGSYAVNVTICSPSTLIGISYHLGAGPSSFVAHIGTQFDIASVDNVGFNEQTIWVKFSAPVTLKIVDDGSWVFNNAGVVYGYAPIGVDGDNLGAYTFVGSGTTTELPVGTPITMNGFYTKSYVSNPFTLRFEVA